MPRCADGSAASHTPFPPLHGPLLHRWHEIEGVLESADASSQGSATSEVWRFDQSLVDWTKGPALLGPAADAADAEVIAVASGGGGGGGGGFLSALLETIGASGGSASSMDVDEDGEPLPPRLTRGRARLLPGAAAAGNGDDRVVLQTSRGDECVELPDGSIECPVFWDGASSDEAPDEAGGEGQRGGPAVGG